MKTDFVQTVGIKSWYQFPPLSLSLSLSLKGLSFPEKAYYR